MTTTADSGGSADSGNAVVVGRVRGAYGVRGWLRVEPFNEPRESVLLHARRWTVRLPAGDVARADAPGIAVPAVLTVEHCRVHGAAIVASVAEIGEREVAHSLRGCEIAVGRTEFPAPPQDEFYWVDLIGCTVVTPQGLELGIVDSIDDHGAHPLLDVRASDGRERLIPFVSAHVPEVDTANRRIVADWDPDF